MTVGSVQIVSLYIFTLPWRQNVHRLKSVSSPGSGENDWGRLAADGCRLQQEVGATAACSHTAVPVSQSAVPVSRAIQPDSQSAVPRFVPHTVMTLITAPAHHGSDYFKFRVNRPAAGDL